MRRWLPLSSGFVHAHVVRSSWDGFVVTPEPLEHAATFPLPVHRRVRSLAPLLRRMPAAAGRRPLSLVLATIARVHCVGIVRVHLGYGVDDVLGFARATSTPVVLSLHGDDVTGAGARRRLAAAVDAVDGVIVPSRFLAGAAEAVGFRADVLHVIPSGVDTATFAPSAPVVGAPPVVLFVGRLVEKKGLDVLLAAWPVIRSAVPDARLRVIGDGPLGSLLRDAPEGVEHELPDPKHRTAQVVAAMRAATVVVQPSRTAGDGDAESLLLVNLEAAASGRPVVSTRHGGIPEYVDDGRSGLLVDEGDAEALASAVIELLRDPSLAAALGAAGPAWAARFDVRACTARVDALYDDLLAGRSTK